MARKKRPLRKTKNTILILCGNTKTEHNYFSGFKRKITRTGKVVVELSKNGDNSCTPVKLVKEAIKIKEERKNLHSIWVVCDKDDFDLSKALGIAEKNGINVAWSNQAFEIWFILHFEYLTKYIDRRKYSEILKVIFGKDYRKTDKTLFNQTFKNIDKAIENAKRGHQQHIRDGNQPDKACSCTTVYKLAEELLNWID